MENRTEIGNALREKLASLEKTPNVDLWNKIATDLNRRKKRRTAFWLYSSILSLGLITCLLIYFNDDSKSKPIIDNQKTNEKANFNKDSVNKFKINEANQIKIDDSVLFKNQNKSLKSVQLSDKNIVKILSNSLKDSFQKKNTKSSRNSKNFYKKTTRLVKSTSDYDEFEVTTKQKYFFKKFKNKSKGKKPMVSNFSKNLKSKINNFKKSNHKLIQKPIPEVNKIVERKGLLLKTNNDEIPIIDKQKQLINIQKQNRSKYLTKNRNQRNRCLGLLMETTP